VRVLVRQLMDMILIVLIAERQGTTDWGATIKVTASRTQATF